MCIIFYHKYQTSKKDFISSKRLPVGCSLPVTSGNDVKSGQTAEELTRIVRAKVTDSYKHRFIWKIHHVVKVATVSIVHLIYVLYSKLANKRDSEFGEHIPVQNKVKVVRSMTRWIFGFIRWNETEENRRGYRHAPVFVSDERFHCHDGTCYSRIRWTKITQWPSAKSNDLFLNAVK